MKKRVKKKTKKNSFSHIPADKMDSVNLILIGIGVVFALIVCEIAYYTFY